MHTRTGDAVPRMEALSLPLAPTPPAARGLPLCKHGSVHVAGLGLFT